MSLLNKALEVHHFDIALAKSATTDGMAITITAKDRNGDTVLGKTRFEMWISEDSGGMGLTDDTYSGTVTAATGAVLTALTAKKHIIGVTAATGIAVITAVDSANPTDQYVAVANPDGSITVSGASGTNWEGA